MIFNRSNAALLLACGLLLSSPLLAAPAKKPAAKKPVAKPAAKKPAAKPGAKPAAKPPVKTAPKAPFFDSTGKPLRPTGEPVKPIETPVEPEPITTGPQTWALLVGVGKYQNPNINALRYPATDAAGIRDALLDPKLGNLPKGNVKLLTDEQATKANIEGVVENFFKPNVKPGDKIVVFLAGHGVAKGVGAKAKSYLLSTDVRGLSIDSLESSAVDLRKLSNSLSELPASQFVVFVDACREDPTPGRGVKGNLQSNVLSRSVSVIPSASASSVSFFACSVGQRAFEDPELKHGVFTYMILDGLREGAVPDRPTGDVNMARLTNYVSKRVAEWAKKTSEAGDYEVEQTPEAITSNLDEPVVLMRVRRSLPEAPVGVAKPRLTVVATPDEAVITVDGKRIGTGSAITELRGDGEYKVRVEAPGYLTSEKTVKVWNGYQQQLQVALQASRGVSAADTMTPELYQKALDAEQRGQWEVATALYSNVTKAAPQFEPAYEHLADLQKRQGLFNESIATLIQMTSQTPSAHSWSLLSRAYSHWVMKNQGGKKPKKVDGSKHRVPQNIYEAAALALNASGQAVKLDSNSAEAQLAAGFAIIAQDSAGQGKAADNKKEALGAFGKAIAFDEKSAENQYAYGFGIRYFGQSVKDEDARKAELKRAIPSLKQAIAARPDYYDAHRELATVYHLLEENEEAIRQYDLANACRGSASDKDEVAGNEVALSALHVKQAANSSGEEKKAHEDASAGYLSDAKETSGDATLKNALRGLQMVGLGGSITSYLPSEMQRALSAINDPRGTIESEIRGKLPGGLRLPF